MLQAIKKLDRKFLIFAGCILLIPIIIILFLLIIQGCSSSKIDYDNYEKLMIKSAKKYFSDKELQPTSESAVSKVTLSELIENKYIKAPEKALKDETCDGSVSVRRNGSSIEENEGGYLNYTVDLTCENHKTNTLSSLILNDLTSSESGLYKQGDSYVFKGEDVNNYVEFYGTVYRILNMDQNNIIKMVKNEKESSTQVWDSKYNTEVNASYGKNIYKDSSLHRRLMDYYKTNKKLRNAKEKMILYDVCIGSRKSSDIGLTSSSDCSTILEDQPISLINITDYANASLDSECTSITSRSCRNYNYLKNANLDSWTVNAVSDNSYEVYYLSSGTIRHQEASKYVSYNFVIYIDGNEMITSGKGTFSNPYVIK